MLLIWRTLFLSCLLFTSMTGLGEEATYLAGAFIVDVDDHATIFINGVEAYHCDFGTTRSEGLKLSVGDHVVVQLVNDIGPRHFAMMFHDSDGALLLGFSGERLQDQPRGGDQKTFRKLNLPNGPDSPRSIEVPRLWTQASEELFGSYMGRFGSVCVGLHHPPQMISQRPR